MFVAGVFIIALYGAGLVLSACIALLPLFSLFIFEDMGFNKWAITIPAFIVTIPWAVAWFTLLSKIDDKFRLGIF